MKQVEKDERSDKVSSSDIPVAYLWWSKGIAKDDWDKYCIPFSDAIDLLTIFKSDVSTVLRKCRLYGSEIPANILDVFLWQYR